MKFSWVLSAVTCAALVFGGSVRADEIRLAVTTSFDNSGLSDVLLPHVRGDLALKLEGWLVRDTAAGLIDGYTDQWPGGCSPSTPSLPTPSLRCHSLRW